MPPSEPATSMTLLGQLRLPEQVEEHAKAWSKFVHLYRPVLHGWAKRQGLQDYDADDLVHDLLLELQAKLPKYDRAKGTFRAWLSTVCKYRCRDFLRRRGILPFTDTPLEEVAVEPPLTDLEDAEHKQAIVNRGLELIRADFSEQTWTAFEQLHRQGRKAPDIARDLGISANAVYMASNRVLTRLRQEIHEFLE